MKIRDLFSGYLDYMLQNGRDPKTIREHQRFVWGALDKAIGDKDIESLLLIDTVAVKKAGIPYGEYGPQRAIVTLRQLMKYAKAAGHSTKFDWRDIEMPKVPKKENEYFTIGELDIIRNALDIKTHAGLRTRALIEVLIDTGMRIGEAVSLDKADIDWENKEVTITNVKTKDREKVYFTDRSLEWLKRYIDFRKDKLPYLFVSGRGRLLSVTSRNYVATHLKGVGGIKKHMKHHNFRKSFVTHLIEGGADIISVGNLARHKSPRTTLRHYAAVNKERAKDVHQKVLNKVLNGKVTAEEFFDTPSKEMSKFPKRVI